MNLFILLGIIAISIAIIDGIPIGENTPKTSVSAGSYVYVDSSGKSHQITYTKDANGIHFNSSNIPKADIPKIIAAIEKQNSFTPYFPMFGFPYFTTKRKRSLEDGKIFVSGIRQPFVRPGEDAPFVSMINTLSRISEEPVFPEGMLFLSPINTDFPSIENKSKETEMIPLKSEESTTIRNEIATKLPSELEKPINLSEHKDEIPTDQATETSTNILETENTMLLTEVPNNSEGAKLPETLTEEPTFSVEQVPLVYEEYTKEGSPIETYIYLVEEPVSYLSNAYNAGSESDQHPMDEATVYTAKLQHQIIYDYINSVLKSQSN